MPYHMRCYILIYAGLSRIILYYLPESLSRHRCTLAVEEQIITASTHIIAHLCNISAEGSLSNLRNRNSPHPVAVVALNEPKLYVDIREFQCHKLCNTYSCSIQQLQHRLIPDLLWSLVGRLVEKFVHLTYGKRLRNLLHDLRRLDILRWIIIHYPLPHEIGIE